LNLPVAATDQYPKVPSDREPSMRAIHILAVSAALAMGAVVVPAQAQNLVQATPPSDSFAPVPAPIFDDLKAEAGSAWVLEAWPMEWRTPTKSKRVTTEQIKPSR
jgi:hypothetical protein